MNTPAFDTLDKKWIIRNVIRMLKFPKSKLLWVAVAEICGTGSTTATGICREFGWNPDHTLEEFFSYSK